MSELRAIGSFAKQLKRVNDGSSSTADVYSVTKYDGFIRSLDYFKKQVFSRDLSSYKIVRKGEFAYSTIHLDEGALGLLEDKEALISPMYTTFQVDESVDRQYIAYLLKSPDLVAQYSLIGQGSINRRKSVAFSSLAELEAFIPPLSEQKKIAEILSGIDQRLISLRKKKQKVENIYRACSSDLFGSVSSQVPLNDICDLQVGFPFRSTDFRDDGIRLLRGENVGYGKPDWERSQFIPPSLVESGSQYHLNAGDIVIGMDRSFTKQGFKVSRISQGDLPCLLVQRVGRFMPKGITGSYLWHILQSVQYQAILSTSEKGMDIPHLSKSEILEPLVPLADDEQQAQICTCLDSLMYSLSAINCSIKIIAQLAIALRLDLLSGRKRVTL
jgi:restriction endonuclease S subunit